MPTATATESFTADRAILLEAVSHCAALCKARTSMEIIKSVRLSVSGGVLTVFGTNLEQSLWVDVAQVDVYRDDLDIAIPADVLLGALRAMTDSTVKLSVEGPQAVMASSSVQFKLNTADPGKFPPASAVSCDASFTVSAERIVSMLGACSGFHARESSRYAVNGTWIGNSGRELFVAATNGRGAILCRETLTTEFAEDVDLILPGIAAGLVCKMVDGEGDVSIAHEGGVVMVSGESWRMTTTLVEGKFPPIFDVIPKTSRNFAEVNPSKFIAGLHAASVTTAEETRAVGVTFSPDHIDLFTVGAEVGSAEIRIDDVRYTGDELTTGIIPEFVIAGLRECEDYAKIGTDGPTKPLRIENARGSVVAVVMAVKPPAR